MIRVQIMLKVQVEVGDGVTANRKYIYCPQCEKKDWFYGWPPFECDSCGFPWGDIQSLIHNLKVRKFYYTKGEIA